MEAEETIEEQEGEVTFDVDVYPREWVAIEDYMWATHPVDVKTRLTATVFLRKEVEAELELTISKGRKYGLSNEEIRELFEILMEE